MVDKLRYGEKRPTALMFDAPIVDVVSRYDFTQWTLNSEQPSGGITVTRNEVVITKFKPNVPILTSNFTGTAAGNTPSSTEISSLSANIEARLSGFTINSGLFTTYTEANIRRNWINAQLKGLWFGPLYTYNNKVLPIESVCDGSDNQYITYAGGSVVAVQDEITALRGTGGGFAQYFHVTDKTDRLTPDWTGIPQWAFVKTDTSPYWDWSPAGDSTWQIGIVLFTGYTPDNDGYITLTAPITIHIENTSPVDPTTIEGYKASVGEAVVYEKDKTFAETLMRHHLASKQMDRFQYPVGNYYPLIESGTVENGHQVAYPIGAAFFDSSARFVLVDGNNNYMLRVWGYYFLENVPWAFDATQIQVGDTVTICGRLIGNQDYEGRADTVTNGGTIYALNGSTSFIGNTHPAPGTPGTGGTLASPYTVQKAVQYAYTIPAGTESAEVYVTGTVSEVISPFAPSYNQYDRLRLPVPTDLATLVASGYPIKFWCTQYDTVGHPGFWVEVASIFSNTVITDPKYTNHLFTNSGGNAGSISIRIDVGTNLDGSARYIDAMGIFDHSNVTSSVYFTITTGVLKSLVNAFRSSRTIQYVGFSREVDISTWSGAFEGAAITTFPTNVFPRNEWFGISSDSEPTCSIQYAADNSRLTTFGNYRNSGGTYPEDRCDVLVVDKYCYGAFSRSDISEIKYILDMKFVPPSHGYIDDDLNYFNAVFNNNSLVIAYIKNLNKGDWVFDGDASHGTPAGNFTDFDSEAANFMLSNVFDLNENINDSQHFETQANSFNSWETSTGYKTPILFNTAQDGGNIYANIVSLGFMEVTVSVTNATVKLSNKNGDTPLQVGVNSVQLRYGINTFVVTAVDSDSPCGATLELSDHFRSELTQGLTSAAIYVPEDWRTRDIIDPAALAIANQRGWTLYAGGTIYTVTP